MMNEELVQLRGYSSFSIQRSSLTKTERMCCMKFIILILAIGVVLGLAGPARAQEPELVNQIVARVNNDIITHLDYMNALRDFREELTRQMQGKSEAEVNAEYEKLKSSVLDFMIDDLLVEQKAKELNLDVEPEVNQQMAQVAKDNGMPNVLALENELKKQGIDPETFRQSIRKKLQQQIVIQREVLAPIYQRLNDKDRLKFYNDHKPEFTTQGEETISEIFLPLEGHTADEVSQRARRLVAELRAGKNFEDAVQENSPVSRATRAQKGKVGSFKQGELNKDISAAISTIKPGEFTEPIRQQDGFLIVRLDERKPATVLPFESPEVQNVIGRAATMERAEEARKKYLKKLREESFVEITKGYVTAQAKPEKADKNN
ncbi:MAG TPA: SurA N-terminal domain-containing protein [Blastocatellia bacterium]|nr:SurA N-terminal domain-containing protein [Blastocatellia bacterium]